MNQPLPPYLSDIKTQFDELCGDADKIIEKHKKKNDNMKITIEIENPQNVSDNLADILCFWKGFDLAMKLNDQDQHTIANNGIEHLRKIRLKIQDAISAEERRVNAVK